MHVYLNICAKLHPDPIWKDGDFSLFKQHHPDKNKNNKNTYNVMNTDMGSVPDPKKVL